MRILLFISLFFSHFIFAQLSNKHWIPPIHARDASVVSDHYLYLSTPNPIPFLVNITYGNGTAIQGSPFTISQGNPQTIQIGSGQPSAMFMDIQDVNIPTDSGGLVLTGTEDFYATFKVRSQNHAEILVSKGIPGIGTSFRLGSLPQNNTGFSRNFVSSFMATQDNTTVTVSDYNNGVVFASGSGDINLDSQTFSLNKGQSVVLSGYSDNSPNLTGFVGALLASDKPIAVVTGNALAGMLSQNDGQDFNLDQIVSVEEVGVEYIIVKGNGSDNSELPLVIATQDNTDVFVNGSVTPITNLNAGDYFLIPSSNYQGSNNNQNIYVTSSSPIYMYQILAGSQSDATNGLNFIPPLSCFFQKSVDLIPSINTIGNTNYSADIIALTYANAIVSINGTPTSSVSQSVQGSAQWATYRIPGFSGNVVVESTGPLAVGVFGASGAAGFSGYYSGFGSEPKDTETILCSSGTTNLLDEIEGNPASGGTWTPPLFSGTDFFDPNNDLPGIYNYSYIGDCSIIDVDITVSVEQAPFAGNDTNLTVCRTDTPVDLFLLLGAGVTNGGIWSPTLTSETSLYDPAVDVSGNYTYTIAANDVCDEIIATITVLNNPIPTIAAITNLEACDDDIDGDDTNGFATFNLSSKTTEILNGQSGVAITYHINQLDANANINPLNNYYSNSQSVYVRLTNTSTNCFNITSFNLIVNPIPFVSQAVNLKQCDTDVDAIADFNLNFAQLLISLDTSLVYSFYTTFLEAQNGTSPILNTQTYTAANNSVVWAIAVNTNGCKSRIIQVNLLVSTTVPVTNIVLEECDVFIDANDPNNDGFDYFDLTGASSQILSQFPVGQSLQVSFYENVSDASAGQNEINTSIPYRNSIANNQLLWVRVDSSVNNECFGLDQYVNLIVNPLPAINLGSDFNICLNPYTGSGFQTINATPISPGNYSYTWTPTNPTINSFGNQSAVYTVTQSGTYSVVVKNTDTNCTETDSVSASLSSEPESVSAILTTPFFSPGLASIEALPVGGYGVYEYSIDSGLSWQPSSVFNGLLNGTYTVLVRDIDNQCGIVESQAILTVTYPAFFTPNGDGYHDFWNIYGLLDSYEANIYIFDRYGKLIKEIKSNSIGWDGTFNGKPVLSSDYWFKVQYTQNEIRQEFKSHFALIR